MDQPKVFLHPTIASDKDADEWPDLEPESCDRWPVGGNYTLRSDELRAAGTVSTTVRSDSGITADLTDGNKQLWSESRVLSIPSSLSQLSQGVREPTRESSYFSVPQAHTGNTNTEQVS